MIMKCLVHSKSSKNGGHGYYYCTLYVNEYSTETYFENANIF